MVGNPFADATSVAYRSWLLEKEQFGYSAHHPNYDADPDADDQRIVYAVSLPALKGLVDDFLSDYAEDHNMVARLKKEIVNLISLRDHHGQLTPYGDGALDLALRLHLEAAGEAYSDGK